MAKFSELQRLRLSVQLPKFLDIVGQDPILVILDPGLHDDIFQFCFVYLRYILQIPLKWLVIILKSRTFNRLFLKLKPIHL